MRMKSLHIFVRLSPLMVTSNILEQVPEITAGDCNVLACQMTSRRTETAADNPKSKLLFNKYFCYRILESGEGSAADALQFSPTPSPPTLH
jgi:hypothetical protein